MPWRSVTLEPQLFWLLDQGMASSTSITWEVSVLPSKVFIVREPRMISGTIYTPMTPPVTSWSPISGEFVVFMLFSSLLGKLNEKRVQESSTWLLISYDMQCARFGWCLITFDKRCSKLLIAQIASFHSKFQGKCSNLQLTVNPWQFWGYVIFLTWMDLVISDSWMQETAPLESHSSTSSGRLQALSPFIMLLMSLKYSKNHSRYIKYI